MKKSYILIILISFLVISPKLYAQVECPCDFESVPKDTECWNEPFEGQDPSYIEDLPNGVLVCRTQGTPGTTTGAAAVELQVSQALIPELTSVCRRFHSEVGAACGPPSTPFITLTPAEVKACQCELLAYTTALNEGGISVSPGPPYECGNVDCAPPPTQPPVANVPTLSGWGLITTAGVLGLLAVIGLFVMRRRKLTA